MTASSIPAFVAYEDVQFPVLPQGIHDASVAVIEQTFVGAFTGSSTRRPIFDSWVMFTNLLRSIVSIEATYIDGSFVTMKTNPKDVDSSYWITADNLNKLQLHEKSALNALLAKSQLFRVDAFIVPECDQGDPGRDEFDYMLWTEHYWTRCRDNNGELLPPHVRRKGYVRVTDE